MTRAERIEWARRARWRSPAAGKVIHQRYGAVVVPMSSKLSAVMNAAEVWGCNWADITDAKVVRPEPGERPVPMPLL